MNDPDIYLLSTERALNDFGLNGVDSSNIFFVNNGTAPLEGKRFRKVYVDRFCYKNENYEECLELLFANRCLMKEHGSFILI